jgi:hypothetical protein
MVAEYQSAVQSKASAKEVFDFLASGAKMKIKVKATDPNAMKVTLKSKVGLLSYGEIVECSITSTQNGCRIDLVGRPVLVTNITADVKGTVTKVSDAIVREFGNR